MDSLNSDITCTCVCMLLHLSSRNLVRAETYQTEHSPLEIC